MLEKAGLQQEVVEAKASRNNLLEDDTVLESIETTFRQFHSFLDMLRDAG